MTKLTEWQRRVALDFAQAFPLVPTTPVRASGNHLAAQNDEPELFPASAQERARQFHQGNDARALELDRQARDAGLLW